MVSNSVKGRGLGSFCLFRCMVGELEKVSSFVKWAVGRGENRVRFCPVGRGPAPAGSVASGEVSGCSSGGDTCLVLCRLTGFEVV